jgi:hypothetical protein
LSENEDYGPRLVSEGEFWAPYAPMAVFSRNVPNSAAAVCCCCPIMLPQFTMHSATKVQPLSSARLRKRWLVAGANSESTNRKACCCCEI